MVQAFGRFRVEALLGRGGMGAVYLAYDPLHDRHVAIKALETELPDVDSAQRFLQEIRITASLSHPHILPLVDSGSADGLLYYVTPFVSGPTLGDMIAAGEILPADKVCKIGIEVADALAYAHDRGIVHRDIKPANILFVAGLPVLADFGLAQALENAGQGTFGERRWIVGTPRYMSPEQRLGMHDVRSDVYSLACSLYEAAAGELPLDRRGSIRGEILHRNSSASAPIPRRLKRILVRAMSPSPDDRFATAAAFGDALREYVGRQRSLAIAATIAVGVGVTAASILSWTDGGRHELHPDRVAVATLINHTGRSDLNAVGAMAADWITQSIQRTGAVDVVPTVSVRAAELSLGSGTHPNDVGRAVAEYTGSGLVFSGAYYLVGDSVQFQLQLMRADQGHTVGTIGPISASIESPELAIQEMRSRALSMLALRFDERLALGPGASAQPPVFGAYERFTRGMDEYAQTNWSSAAAFFAAARELDRGFVQAWLFEALALTNMGDYARAEVLLDSVSEKRAELSDYDRYWLDYRRAFVAGNQPAALAAIRGAARLSPMSKASYNLGVEAMEQGLLDEALDALDNLEPTRGAMVGFRPYLATVATVNHLMGRHRVELQNVREMIRLFPTDPWARSLEVVALAALGRREAVADRLRSAAEESTRSDPSEVLALVIQASDEFAVHGDTSAARETLQWGELWWGRQTPESVASQRSRTQWLEVVRRLGRYDDARRMVIQLRSESANDIELLALDGVIAAASGDRTRATAISDSLSTIDEPYSFGANHYALARLSATLVELPATVSHLRRARASGFPLGPRSHQETAFIPFHSKREFKSLMSPWELEE